MSSEQHYNKVAQVPPVGCAALRQAHNKCKQHMFHLCTKIMNKPLTQCACLDLACGRGGDINKLKACKQYAGVDTALMALRELRRRANEIGMEVQLYHQDASQLKQYPHNHADLVVCNFALHYFCDTAEHCAALVQVVSQSLKPGGVFCGTYQRHFHTPRWGDEYYAQVGDCVDALEWKVPWDKFLFMCHANDLALVYHQPFGLLDANADFTVAGFIIQKAQVQYCDTKQTD